MLPARAAVSSARATAIISCLNSSRRYSPLVRRSVPPALTRTTTRKGRAMASSSSPSLSKKQPLPFGDTFFLDSFALRQWQDTASGTRFDLREVTLEQVVERVHAAHSSGKAPLVDGYAPFCKHIFLENDFTSAAPGSLPITASNRHLVRSGYTSRRPEELAVLSRWFDEEEVVSQLNEGKPLSPAKYLDVILYSREQLVAERASMPSKGGEDSETHPLPPGDDSGNPKWGIISLKGQDEPFETPMQPITAMRNALGREQGGSGVPLDREKYDEAVEYWRERAAIVRGSPSGE